MKGSNAESITYQNSFLCSNPFYLARNRKLEYSKRRKELTEVIKEMEKER